MFYNRFRELAALQDRYERGEAELVVVYGRRRVGKSALLQQLCSGKPHLYFVAGQVTEQENLNEFYEVMRQHWPDRTNEGVELKNWEAAFNEVVRAAGNERLIVIIDEFPYLCEENPGLPSLLQRWWDRVGKSTHLFLVLTGSTVAFMEREVLSEKSPLFGRRTSQVHLHPLLPWEAALFFEGLPDADERMTLFGVLGGVPAYLERFAPGSDWRWRIQKEVFHPQGFFYEEVPLLLRMELRRINIYLSVLKTIAFGATRLSEIATKTRVSVSSLPNYLSIMQELDLIHRETPFMDKNPEKSRRGIYRIRDPFIAFWCRFVLPYRSMIEAGQAESLYQSVVQRDLATYLGLWFEEACRLYVLHRWGVYHGAPALRAGRMWGKNYEIDILAELFHGDGNCFLAAECKWWDKPVGITILEQLKAKTAHLPETMQQRLSFALFSRSGFTPELKGIANTENITLIAPADLLRNETTGESPSR